MSTKTQAKDLRLHARDLKGRLDSGEQATLLDARSPKAYESSDRRLQGDVRVDPGDFHINDAWPRDQLTAVY